MLCLMKCVLFSFLSAAGHRENVSGQDEVRHGRGADVLPSRRHPQLHDPQDVRKLTPSPGRPTRNAHVIRHLDACFVPSVFLFLF